MSQTTFFLSLLPCELLFVFVPRHTGWRVGVMVCGCCTIHSARDGMLLLCSAAFCGCHLLGSESAFISHDTFFLCGILRSPQCCHVYLFGSVGTEPPLWLRILINPKTPYGGEKFENHSTRIIFPMVWSSEGTPDHSRRSIQMMTLLFTVIIYRDKKKIKNGTRTPDHSLK